MFDFRRFPSAKSIGSRVFWRVASVRGYHRAMGGEDYRRDARTPDSPLPEGEQYRNKWVAVRDGHVIASATSHEELVRKVRSRGIDAGTFVARHVEVPPTRIVVGVG